MSYPNPSYRNRFAKEDDPDEVAQLRTQIQDSQAYDWIYQVIRHLVMAEVAMTPTMIRHAITVGTKRFDAKQPIDPHEITLVSRSTHPDSVVYYVRTGTQVKIGTSYNLAERLRALNPQELLIVERGALEIERKRHKDFATLRIHGEWFALQDPLVTYIELLRERFEGSFGIDFSAWKIKQSLPSKF